MGFISHEGVSSIVFHLRCALWDSESFGNVYVHRSKNRRLVVEYRNAARIVLGVVISEYDRG